jgi:hypothetical protein
MRIAELTRVEKHDAIVRLYREGYTQEKLGQMWGYTQPMITIILAAEIRNQQLAQKNINNLYAKVTPSQESIIRQAPVEVQDTIAELVATRVEEIPPTPREVKEAVRQGKPAPKKRKPKKMKVSQTRTLVEQAKYLPERLEETVDKMRRDPSELVATRIFDRGSHSIPVHSTSMGAPVLHRIGLTEIPSESELVFFDGINHEMCCPDSVPAQRQINEDGVSE